MKDREEQNLLETRGVHTRRRKKLTEMIIEHSLRTEAANKIKQKLKTTQHTKL